jgi:hypothetical protein
MNRFYADALCGHFKPKTEILVLWARSEKIGCAVTLRSGMMEYWRVGMMGLAE